MVNLIDHSGKESFLVESGKLKESSDRTSTGLFDSIDTVVLSRSYVHAVYCK